MIESVVTDLCLPKIQITLEFSSFMLFCIALNLQYESDRRLSWHPPNFN